MTEIYLDNNATTRLHPIVADEMHRLASLRLTNPASQHQSGRRARQYLEDARDKLAGHLGCQTIGMENDQVIFTSGGTESNNLAIFGLRSSPKSFLGPDRSMNGKIDAANGSIVLSTIEHPSVLAAAGALEKGGDVQVQYCPVDKNGVLDLNAFQKLIDRHDQAIAAKENSNCISLVSIMLANNETGVMQPVQAVVEMCKPRGILVHTDAVQVLGKVPLHFQSLGVDAMTVTAHKVHGPPGIGALVLRAGVEIRPHLYGGFQQMGVRPGTECVTLAVGFEKAIELAISNLAERLSRMQKSQEILEDLLLKGSEAPEIIGANVKRLPAHDLRGVSRGTIAKPFRWRSISPGLHAVPAPLAQVDQASLRMS